MTLIVALSAPEFTVMASDRLVTLASQRTGSYLGDHNAIANKTLILVTEDAAVAVGFCGSAYIGRSLTDDWIAEVVTANDEDVFGPDGAKAIFGLRKPNKLRLHQICARLRRGLSESVEGKGVTIMIVGWRYRRHLLTPVHLVFGASTHLGSELELKMRPIWPLQRTFRWIGAPLSIAEFGAAFTAYSAGNVRWDEDRTTEFLTALIREKAKTDRTVGPHIMSVTLHHPSFRRALCRFDPLETHYGNVEIDGVKARSPVAYNPWVITPSAFLAPTETSGIPGTSAHWEVDDWKFEMEDVPRAAPAPSNVGWAKPHARLSKPR